MKDSQKFEELTLSELKKRESFLIVITYSLGTLLLLLVVTGIYKYVISDKLDTISIIPLALSPILLMSIQNIKKIRAEIKSRQ